MYGRTHKPTGENDDKVVSSNEVIQSGENVVSRSEVTQYEELKIENMIKIDRKTTRSVSEGVTGNHLLKCISSRGKLLRNLDNHSKLVKSSKIKNSGRRGGRTCRGKGTQTGGGGRSDIRTYLEPSPASANLNRSIYDSHLTADNYTHNGVVLEKDEDGFELINYPTYRDQGPFSFSLSDFEYYTDFEAQDELQDQVKTFWTVFKQHV